MTPGDVFFGAAGEKGVSITVLKWVDKRHILIQCSCGSAPKRVRSDNVQTGRTRSCGCRASRGPMPQHGLSRTPEYEAWRGKAHCPGWATAPAFVRDLGLRPAGHALWSDGPKLFCGSCAVCRRSGKVRTAAWLPLTEALSAAVARAKSSTATRVLVDDQRLTVSQAATALGLTRNTIYYRLEHHLEPGRPKDAP